MWEALAFLLDNISIRFGSKLYDNLSEVIEAFISTSRYLDDLLNIDNNFFESMVNHIYPPELQ